MEEQVRSEIAYLRQQRYGGKDGIAGAFDTEGNLNRDLVWLFFASLIIYWINFIIGACNYDAICRRESRNTATQTA